MLTVSSSSPVCGLILTYVMCSASEYQWSFVPTLCASLASHSRLVAWSGPQRLWPRLEARWVMYSYKDWSGNCRPRYHVVQWMEYRGMAESPMPTWMAICAHIYSWRRLVQRPVAQEHGHFVLLKTVLATSGPLGAPMIVFRVDKKTEKFYISSSV